MAYPGNHMLTTFGGPLYGTEEWSCGIRSTPGFGDGGGFGSGTPTLPSPKAEAVAAAISTWWSGQTITSTRASLAWVKHNNIEPNGRYAEPFSDLVEFSTPVTNSGTSAPVYPPQVSLVVTLETGVTRGLAARGRIFLPAPATGMLASGLIGAPAAAQVASSVASLLTALNGVEGFGQVSVFSDVREGASRPVIGVTCGQVLDTMRSRRAQIGEERSPLSPVTGGT